MAEISWIIMVMVTSEGVSDSGGHALFRIPGGIKKPPPPLKAISVTELKI